MSAVKIYAMNDTEWIVASSELQAALVYAGTISRTIDSCVKENYIDTEHGYPRALTVREMRRLRYHDEDDKNYGKDNYRPRSFKQQLDQLIGPGAEFPRYFAGRE